MALAPIAANYVGADPTAITNAQLLRPIDRELPNAVRRKIFHANALTFLGLAGPSGVGRGRGCGGLPLRRCLFEEGDERA